jgi:peroxisome-assembly ATPase
MKRGTTSNTWNTLTQARPEREDDDDSTTPFFALFAPHFFILIMTATLHRIPRPSFPGFQRKILQPELCYGTLKASSSLLGSIPRKASSSCHSVNLCTKLSLASGRQSPRSIHGYSSPAPFSSLAISESSRDEMSSGGAVTRRLETLIETGEIQQDEHQFQAAAELDRIYNYLMTNDPPPQQESTISSESLSETKSTSFFGSLFRSSKKATDLSQAVTSFFATPKGAYMFGGVGCGKTFLMNLLYDSIDKGPWAKEKQKVHFHKFMLEVHQHMHQQRKLTPDGDLIAPVVREILKQGRLLCLDEFQVTDVADALILQRLFDGLWSHGCILIATSNRPPSDLYLHGLQRDRFLPFIDRLERQCSVVDLLDSETDYRMLARALSRGTGDDHESSSTLADPVVYFLDGGAASSKSFRNLFYQLTENHPTSPLTLTTQGRNVPIPLACTHKKIAFFDFSDLCQKAAGAADYLVIASSFSTVFCHNVPKLTIHELNWLRRFITFVDTMYEMKVTLVLHTAQPCETVSEIFSVDGQKKDYQQDEVFAFDRTLSRLEEMSSTKYLKSQWLGGSKKRRADQKLAMYQSFPSYIMTHRADDEHERVVTKVAIHPSLDNHHLGGN